MRNNQTMHQHQGHASPVMFSSNDMREGDVVTTGGDDNALTRPTRAQFKVSTRLALGFGIVLFMLVAISGTGLVGMANIRARLDDIVRVRNAETRLATNLRGAVSGIAISIRNMALMTDDKEVASEQATIKAQEKVYADNYQALAQTFDASALTTGDERRLFDRLKEEQAATVPMVEKEAMNWALATDQGAAVKVLIDEVRPKQVEWLATLDELLSLEQARTEAAANDAAGTYAAVRALTLAAALAALIIGAMAALLITRSILKQLGADPADAQRLASEIAAGNLTTAATLAPGDQHSLMASLETMRTQLLSMVRHIKASADSIAVSASEIAMGNVNLSQRTEQQAASLQETAASMEDLTSAVRQNTENATQASSSAGEASGTASQGGSVVERVVTTMRDISTSSSKVAEIIGVIEGIAFQTNILALNAAVEAARAGDQGRGFAVVAGEVRTLAQRSASAAKEIKVLIEESVSHVSAGSSLVADAGATMNDVVRSVNRVTDIMSKIALASTAQGSGIEHVNTAVREMDSVTQQNAALVEQITAAAQAMADQANSLRGAIGVFRVANAADE